MRKRWKLGIVALAMSLLAITPIGQTIHMSSIAYAAQNSTDPKSGLTVYWDSNLKKYGYTDSSGNIVIPAQWGRADRFYAGYAMVVDDVVGEHIGGEDDYRMYRAQYRIINESGQMVGAFTLTGDWTTGNTGYMGQKRRPYRFQENDKGLFGYEEYGNADTNALLYVKYYINGEIEYINYPQFVNKLENNIFTRYNIGTFRNGTANIYELTGTETLSLTGDGNWFKKRAIASITVDGEVLDEINPDSEWVEHKEIYPDYGINQLASVSEPTVEDDTAKGWKQDTTGWWYVNDDGSYPTNQWVWIDGNKDGISECYYFDSNGYLLVNTTTPDGYTVNADGAWVVDSVVQTQGSTQQPATLPNSQSPIKLKTDFIKSEILDILGKDKSYAMERLAAYNPYYYTSEEDGKESITCHIDDMASIMVDYDDNDIVNSVYGLNGAIFNGPVENESDLDSKLGGGMTTDGIGMCIWILSESPHIELVYMTSDGFYSLYYEQY